MFHMKHPPSGYPLHGGRITAGNENLPVVYVIKNIILTAYIQLTHHVIKQRHRLFPADLPQDGSLRHLQGKHGTALLPL